MERPLRTLALFPLPLPLPLSLSGHWCPGKVCHHLHHRYAGCSRLPSGLYVYLGGNVELGYTLVENIDFDSASPNLSSCDPGSIGLYNIVVSDPTAQVIEACGGLDDPCPPRGRGKKKQGVDATDAESNKCFCASQDDSAGPLPSPPPTHPEIYIYIYICKQKNICIISSGC